MDGGRNESTDEYYEVNESLDKGMLNSFFLLRVFCHIRFLSH